MDPTEVTELLRSYADRDRDFRATDWQVLDDTAVECGRVQRASLLHMYRRRLGRTGEGTDLRAVTERLVNFLEAYEKEELEMISFRTADGRFWLFLADEEKSRILFWMSMFS